MKIQRFQVAAALFALFGVAYVIAVFILTDEWPQRLHSILVGAINIGAAMYLRQQSKGKAAIEAVQPHGHVHHAGSDRHMHMTLEEYRRRMKRLTWIEGITLFGILTPGVLGALFLAGALADSSTWSRPAVFWSMMPTILAPVVIAVAITEQLDRRIGVLCACGQSLSMGKQVERLLREGGACPRCGRTVVIQPPESEQDTGRDSGKPEVVG